MNCQQVTVRRAENCRGRSTSASGRWDHVRVTTADGELRFEKYQMSVLGVDRTSVRRPKGRERISIAPELEIVRVRTPTAILEWGIVDGHLDQALADVAR
jgi:hypothetical protein